MKSKTRLTLIIQDTKKKPHTFRAYPLWIGYIFYKEILSFEVGKYHIELNLVRYYFPPKSII